MKCQPHLPSPVNCWHSITWFISPQIAYKLWYMYVEVGPVDQEVRNDLYDSHDKVDSPQDEECKEAKPHLHQRNGRQALGRLLSEASDIVHRVQLNCACLKAKGKRVREQLESYNCNDMYTALPLVLR